MLTNNREIYRQAFIFAWQKHQNKMLVEPLEVQLIEIILLHPEHHHLLEQTESETQEFSLDQNPFFHMGLHLAIREQIHTDRPKGIASIYQRLLRKHLDAHHVEHQLMDSLKEIMWEAQALSQMPDEAMYLEKLYKLG